MRLVPVHLLATCLAVAVSHVNFTSNCDHDHAEWNRHQVASAIQSWIDSIQVWGGASQNNQVAKLTLSLSPTFPALSQRGDL